MGSSEVGAPTAAEEALAEVKSDNVALRWKFGIERSRRNSEARQFEQQRSTQQEVVGGLLGAVEAAQAEQARLARQAEQAEEMRRSLAELHAEMQEKYPDTWRMSQPGKPEHGRFPVAVDSRKFLDVQANFMQTAQAGVRIVSIERVQNVKLWHAYAVNLQDIVSREKEQDESKPQSRFERLCLFHGCKADVVPRIVQQGFNRSFCFQPRNATVWGKGVYFARDASYSASPQYSTPDAHGHQHIFACRVVVGEYCLGKRDALTPDVRSGHTLYDSTVNNLGSPSIFVTYHDAQAYPEFLIKFTTS